jgi:hypothetical protein
MHIYDSDNLDNFLNICQHITKNSKRCLGFSEWMPPSWMRSRANCPNMLVKHTKFYQVFETPTVLISSQIRQMATGGVTFDLVRRQALSESFGKLFPPTTISLPLSSLHRPLSLLDTYGSVSLLGRFKKRSQKATRCVLDDPTPLQASSSILKTARQHRFKTEVCLSHMIWSVFLVSSLLHLAAAACFTRSCSQHALHQSFPMEDHTQFAIPLNPQDQATVLVPTKPQTVLQSSNQDSTLPCHLSSSLSFHIRPAFGTRPLSMRIMRVCCPGRRLR